MATKFRKYGNYIYEVDSTTGLLVSLPQRTILEVVVPHQENNANARAASMERR
jgi:hypothetical protein